MKCPSGLRTPKSPRFLSMILLNVSHGARSIPTFGAIGNLDPHTTIYVVQTLIASFVQF